MPCIKTTEPTSLQCFKKLACGTSEGPDHLWNTQGLLVVESCEKYCQFCYQIDGSSHEWKFAWYLRRHVSDMHARHASHPNLTVWMGTKGDEDDAQGYGKLPAWKPPPQELEDYVCSLPSEMLKQLPTMKTAAKTPKGQRQLKRQSLKAQRASPTPLTLTNNSLSRFGGDVNPELDADLEYDSWDAEPTGFTWDDFDREMSVYTTPFDAEPTPVPTFAAGATPNSFRTQPASFIDLTSAPTTPVKTLSAGPTTPVSSFVAATTPLPVKTFAAGPITPMSTLTAATTPPPAPTKPRISRYQLERRDGTVIEATPADSAATGGIVEELNNVVSNARGNGASEGEILFALEHYAELYKNGRLC